MNLHICLSLCVSSALLLSACERSIPEPAAPAPPSQESPQPPAPSKHEPAPAPPPTAAGADKDKDTAVKYRGAGTEPFWGFAVSQRELRVNYPEPEPSVASAYTVEERPDGRVYKGSALSATVTFKSCSDGMSDRVYPHTLEVHVGERVLKGCGWPEGHDLGPAP
jgi:uncharacterized membrane protein